MHIKFTFMDGVVEEYEFDDLNSATKFVNEQTKLITQVQVMEVLLEDSNNNRPTLWCTQ